MVPLKLPCFYSGLNKKAQLDQLGLRFLDDSQIRNEAAGMPFTPTCMLNIFPA